VRFIVTMRFYSLSKGRRERELVRITKENMEMLARISNKQPAISREMHEKEWKDNLQFMSNISSFPEDWYLRNGKYRNISRSNPALNSTRTEETERRTETQSAVDVKPEQKLSKKSVEPINEQPRKASVKKPSPVAVVEKKSAKATTPVDDKAGDENITSDEVAEEVKDSDEAKNEYAEDFD
jgi:hypothetical protein